MTRRQTSAELSAERRTPRKVEVHEPKTPTPNQRLKRKAPASAPNGVGPAPASMANGVHSQPSSACSGPPKLEIRTPAKSAHGAPTILGKRRATEGQQPDRQSNGSIASSPRKLSRGVNDIVRQLNGVDARGTKAPHSHAATAELPMRGAAPKLRDRPHVHGIM